MIKSLLAHDRDHQLRCPFSRRGGVPQAHATALQAQRILVDTRPAVVNFWIYVFLRREARVGGFGGQAGEFIFRLHTTSNSYASFSPAGFSNSHIISPIL